MSAAVAAPEEQAEETITHGTRRGILRGLVATGGLLIAMLIIIVSMIAKFV